MPAGLLVALAAVVAFVQRRWLPIVAVILILLFVWPGWGYSPHHVAWEPNPVTGKYFDVGPVNEDVVRAQYGCDDYERSLDVNATSQHRTCVYQRTTSQASPSPSPAPSESPSPSPSASPTPQPSPVANTIPCPTVLGTFQLTPEQCKTALAAGSQLPGQQSSPPSNPPSGGSQPLAQPAPAATTPGPCPVASEASRILGIQVIQIGSEPCAFVWDSKGTSASNPTVPAGWWATATLADGNKVVLAQGPVQLRIVAGTFRMISQYGGLSSCDQLENERYFARTQRPTFQVEPMGFSCDGSASPPPAANSAPASQPTQAPTPAASECLSGPDEAAQKLGGDAASWTVLTGDGMKYKGAMATLNPPDIGRLDYPGGSARKGDPAVKAAEATYWCHG